MRRGIARLYGRIVEATGWTLPAVDALSLNDVDDLLEHWREEPPIGLCLRARWGIKAQERTKEEPAPDPKKIYSASEIAAEEAMLRAMASQMNAPAGTR